MKRKYESPRRAAGKEDTTKAILDAAVRLHAQGNTDIDVLAREAGVAVATVRKHFPTREHIYEGCTRHFMASHPAPDPGSLAAIPDPFERIRAIVAAVYAMHEAAFGVAWLAHTLQDESPTMAQNVAMLDDFVRAAVEAMLAGMPSTVATEAVASYARGLLSPLTYRALRLNGELDLSAATQSTYKVLTLLLGVQQSDH